MMTLVFTRSNGKKATVNIAGDNVHISRGYVMDGEAVVATVMPGGFLLASDTMRPGPIERYLYTELDISMGDEG